MLRKCEFGIALRHVVRSLVGVKKQLIVAMYLQESYARKVYDRIRIGLTGIYTGLMQHKIHQGK